MMYQIRAQEDIMEQETVTISKAEYDRLIEIRRAAVSVIGGYPTRHASRAWHKDWLADLNQLAMLLPVTRRFDIHPLV
jgi:hypothetical protein